jgi:hypothetical protein
MGADSAVAAPVGAHASAAEIARSWPLLWEANADQIRDPDQVAAGTVLQVPPQLLPAYGRAVPGAAVRSPVRGVGGRCEVMGMADSWGSQGRKGGWKRRQPSASAPRL